MNDKIKQRILDEAQGDYKKFTASLIPNINNVLGVRIPVLRKIAKEVYKSHNWQEFINSNDAEFMEETMLKGMIIGCINDSAENILKQIENFVPKINNWAVCDTFCAGLKFTSKNKEKVWEFIQPYLNSDKEFEIRFGLVMLLNYFVEEKYINQIFKILDNINCSDYYAKMAAAWAFSICFIKLENVSFEYLKKSKLEDWTYNKSIQKCIESYRVSPEMKNLLKRMKR